MVRSQQGKGKIQQESNSEASPGMVRHPNYREKIKRAKSPASHTAVFPNEGVKGLSVSTVTGGKCLGVCACQRARAESPIWRDAALPTGQCLLVEL